MNKNKIELVKHSALIQMSNRVTAIQRKSFNALLFFAKKQLSEESPIDYKFVVNANIILKIIGLGSKNYKYLKEFLSELRNIDVKYNLLGKDKKHQWGEFSLLAGFDYKNGAITYSFPHQILDALINPDIYAYIDLVVIKGLKSKYAIALYELLRDYKNTQVPKMELEKFRELMGVRKEQYLGNIPMFKRCVIEKAVSEINKSEKISFIVSYELFKTGKRYTYIKFTIKQKPQAIQDKRLYIIKLDRKTRTLLLSLLPKQYRSKSAEELINKYQDKGLEYIKAQIKYTNQSNPKNYLAYLLNALIKDYAGFEKSSLALKIEVKQKEEKLTKQRAVKEKQMEENKQREDERKKGEDLDRRFKNLSKQEQKELEGKAKKNLMSQGIQTSFIIPALLRIERNRLLEKK
jgi:cation transport regulator ChaC